MGTKDGGTPPFKFIRNIIFFIRSRCNFLPLWCAYIHKITILPVLTALGLFPDRAYEPLGAKAIDWYRAFRGGNHIPFCGNVVVEKLQCAHADYVRILNNQVPSIIFVDVWLIVVPLEGCGDGPTGFTDGLCEVEHLSWIN